MEQSIPGSGQDSKKGSDPDQVVQMLLQREQEQATLLCLGQKIAAARNRKDLWDIVTEQLLDMFNSQYYTLCLLDQDGKTHSPFLHSDEKKIASRTEQSPIVHADHAIDDGIFNSVLSADGPIVYELRKLMQRAQVPPYIYHWHNAGVKQMLLVKVINGQAPKGVLYLYSMSDHSISPDLFQLLTGVADLLGTGICNVLANEKVEEQLREIENYKLRLEEENSFLREEQKLGSKFLEIIGDSLPMQDVFTLVEQVSQSDATVLLLGESGTGKELVARAIHQASSRKDRLMIRVNCAALPPSLIESELFGHEKGAFTGALERRIGKFELATGSTLFLDEIGELPAEAQVKLLRVLQEKELERVGGSATIKVNVRIIAATNRDLEKEVRDGRFRLDLFYRLNVFPITLPPLRARKEDIPGLAAHFIAKYAKSTGRPVKKIAKPALDSLAGYEWPGNIRELEHLIERTILLSKGESIGEFVLPVARPSLSSTAGADRGIQTLEEVERDHILKIVRLSKGRISGKNGAALKLGLPATTLISRMHKLGIRKEHFVAADGPEDEF